MIVLGEFYLDIEEMSLSKDGRVIVLEPKVLKVLLYFIDNNEHYISMQELHDNLWQGRIVSDTAVRRIVSKLRILFGDDHKNPNYIKSLPKKGYKLICKVQSESNNRQNNSIVDKTVNESQTNYQNLQKSKLHIFTKKRKTFTMISALIMLIIGTVIYYQSVTTKPKKILIEKIESLPGNKLAIAQSLDKQYFAFSGQVNKNVGYQIYFKEKEEKNFKSISTNIFFPNSLAFSADNKFLFYVDFKEGDSSLNLIELKKGKYKTSKLIRDFNFIVDVFTGKDTHFIYFTGQKKPEKPSFIYQYNINTKQLTQLSSAIDNNIYDLFGDISPDGRLLLVARRYGDNNVNEVRVINLITNNVVYSYQQEQIIYDLQWIDNENFLFLDMKKLLKINYKHKKQEQITIGKSNLKKILVDNNQVITAIQGSSYEKLFLEFSLPFKTWRTEHVYNLNSNIYSLNYTKNLNLKLVLFRDKKVFNLAKLNTENNQLTHYLSTEYNLDIIDSIAEDKILLDINHRFALFNAITSTVEYITLGDEYIGDAVFSLEQKSILFSVKDYRGWQIKRYDIKTKKTSLFLSNYRYIRLYHENYLVADAEGKLFFYDDKAKSEMQLNYQIDIGSNTRWAISGNYMYWSGQNLVNTTFYQVDITDLKNIKETKKVFDYNKIRPDFVLNNDGASLIFAERRQSDEKIVQIKNILKDNLSIIKL